MARVPFRHCATYVLSFQPGGLTGPWADVENRSGSLPYVQTYSFPPPRALQARGTVSSRVCQPADLFPPRPRLKPWQNLTFFQVL
jgi:hypothetical protein